MKKILSVVFLIYLNIFLSDFLPGAAQYILRIENNFMTLPADLLHCSGTRKRGAGANKEKEGEINVRVCLFHLYVIFSVPPLSPSLSVSRSFFHTVAVHLCV